MTASVIVPSYNGAKKLPNLLAALEQQTINNFEVIIVSDGSVDNTAAIVNDGGWKLNLKLIEQQNKGRSATRNRGAAVATSDLLIFFDDDMRPWPACIEEHVKHHQQYPHSIVTGGLQEEVTENATELFKYKAFLSDKWLSPLKGVGSKALAKDQVFVTTANFSIAKKDFNILKGFDERLTDAEDYEFAVRAVKHGLPLFFRNDAFAWHDDVITTASYIKRQRQYAVANAKLRDIHPNWVKEGYLKLPYKPTLLKAILFNVFCSRIWIDALDNNKFKKLPLAFRYRLYDYIITANGAIYPEKVALT
ncbi:MAG: glycosyltransferase [Flavipsychrobacter sp.]|nr:glycosyltransferase [Flavipsychrobacter sp.]